MKTDEQGVVAIIVAILAVVFLAFAAFAVDLGIALTSKRQLSLSADAASIAGAQALNPLIPVGTAWSCPAELADPGSSVADDVNNVAVSQNAANDWGGDSELTSTILCNPDGRGDIQVQVDNTRAVPEYFGQFAGGGLSQVGNTATASLFVPRVATGLRPFAACVDTVQTAAEAGAGTPFIVVISREEAICGDTSPGQWGFVNFLDQGDYGEFWEEGQDAYWPASSEPCIPDSEGTGSAAGGKEGCQTEWTENGYGGPVWIPNDELAANSGGTFTPSKFIPAITGLIGETIQLPVSQGYGEAAGTHDIVGFVSAVVCAVNVDGDVTEWTSPSEANPCSPSLPDSTSLGWTPSDPEANPTPPFPDEAWDEVVGTPGAGKDAELWVVLTDYVSAVPDGEPLVVGGSVCEIGDPSCDFLSRGVILYK